MIFLPLHSIFVSNIIKLLLTNREEFFKFNSGPSQALIFRIFLICEDRYRTLMRVIICHILIWEVQKNLLESLRKNIVKWTKLNWRIKIYKALPMSLGFKIIVYWILYCSNSTNTKIIWKIHFLIEQITH